MKNQVIDAQKHYVFRIRMAGTRAAQSVLKQSEDKEKLEAKVVNEKKRRKDLRKAFKAKIKISKKKEEEAKAKIEALEEEILQKKAEYLAAREIIQELDEDLDRAPPDPDLEPPEADPEFDLDLDLRTGDLDLLEASDSSSESLRAFLAFSNFRAFLVSMSLSSSSLSSLEEYSCAFAPRPLPFLYLFLMADKLMPSSLSLSAPSRYPELSRLCNALSLVRLILESRRMSARNLSSSSLTLLYRLASGSRPTCEMTLIPAALFVRSAMDRVIF